MDLSQFQPTQSMTFQSSIDSKTKILNLFQPTDSFSYNITLESDEINQDYNLLNQKMIKQRLENLLEFTEDVKKKNIYRLTEVDSVIDVIKKNYFTTIKKLKQLFKEIIFLVQDKEQKYIEQLNLNLKQQLEQIASYSNQIRLNDFQLDKFRLDINKNFQPIIEEMKITSFKQVEDSYKQRIEEIESSLKDNSLNPQQVFNHVETVQNLKSIIHLYFKKQQKPIELLNPDKIEQGNFY